MDPWLRRMTELQSGVGQQRLNQALKKWTVADKRFVNDKLTTEE
jgi:hypothetical protein